MVIFVTLGIFGNCGNSRLIRASGYCKPVSHDVTGFHWRETIDMESQHVISSDRCALSPGAGSRPPLNQTMAPYISDDRL